MSNFFRSLPLRLRIISTFPHKPLPCIHVQKRNVVLLHNTLSRAQIGLHKILPYVLLPKFLPALGPTRKLKLVTSEKKEALPLSLSLSQILQKEYVAPGRLLCRPPPSKEEVASAEQDTVPYTIIKLKEDVPPPKNPRSSKKGIMAKRIQIGTWTDTEVFKLRMQKTFEFMQQGHAIEVHVKPVNKKDYVTVAWTLKNQFHFSPEIILAAMPEGSRIILDAVSNGNEYGWVMVPKYHKLGWQTENYTRKRIALGGERKPPMGTEFAKLYEELEAISYPKESRVSFPNKARKTAPGESIPRENNKAPGLVRTVLKAFKKKFYHKEKGASNFEKKGKKQRFPDKNDQPLSNEGSTSGQNTKPPFKAHTKKDFLSGHITEPPNDSK